MGFPTISTSRKQDGDRRQIGNAVPPALAEPLRAGEEALKRVRTKRKKEEGVVKVASEDSVELMDNMIRGNRLKDISDLPLDLAV
jgi:hypothetical protein